MQDGLQDELSSYADEVFETPSEAAIKELDEGELTGSALDKNELERSHLMLWVYICTILQYMKVDIRMHCSIIGLSFPIPGL